MNWSNVLSKKLCEYILMIVDDRVGKCFSLNLNTLKLLIHLSLQMLFSDEEQRFMYKINQGHLTVFCIVFV